MGRNGYFLSYIPLLMGCISCVYSSSYVVETFTNVHLNESFLQMVKDEETGKLYMAAVNSLYRFSDDLVMEQSVRTGPKLDNPHCFILGNSNPCSRPLHSTNRFSKALLILNAVDEVDKRLIYCSTLFHGVCEKRLLTNLSHVDEMSEHKMVVSNNRTATTVAFIGPGPPTDNGQPTQALYVGASWTNNGVAFSSLVPAFSSRDLNTFRYTYQGISYSSNKKVEIQHHQSFPIYYIYGFSSKDFSYMLTVQKRSTQEGSTYISKLIRVCQRDNKFLSYTEVELRCEHNGGIYNLAQTAYVGKPGEFMSQTLKIHPSEDVLFATFEIGSSPKSSSIVKKSALCIYPMRQVRKMFTENIQQCFEGIGNTGPDHIIQPKDCKNLTVMRQDIDDDYCGNHEVNTPINGNTPIVARAALILNTSITAVTVTTTHKYTVAFLGSSDGHVIKVALRSQTVAEAYEDIVMEAGNQIHKDMFFDDDQDHLYVFTDNKIYKIIVQDCTQYKSCGTCRGAKDPYCGWCSLEDKCSLRRDCKDHDQELRWLEYSGQTCTNITHVVPDRIQKDISKPTTLTLNISNLPMFNGHYKCAFSKDGLTLTTAANLTFRNIITCDTPPANQLPPFPTGEDHIVMKLAVLMNNTEFVFTNFTFFDCEVHSKDACYKCTASRFKCTWCIKNHMCTHNPIADCSTNDLFVSSSSLPVTVHHQVGPSFCPYVMTSLSPPQIVVPSGTTKKVSVSGHNIKDFQKPIHCVFSLNGEETVTATVTHLEGTTIDLIECSLFYFNYPDNTKFWNVPFKIVWGNMNKPLDNPQKVQVKIYKCNYLASSCGECLVEDTAYNCGWCRTTDMCSIQQNCKQPAVKDWLSQSDTCPNPIIQKIRPLSGPKKGGTELTIIGKDLGKTYDDIVSNVDIIGIQCNPKRDKYEPAVKIVCVTGEFHSVSSNSRGPVRVTVNRQYLAESKEYFQYVDPVLTDIDPKKGPKSGGTKVTIIGKHMNAGTNITVKIGGHVCTMESKSLTEFVCISSHSTISMNDADVYMQFDRQDVPNNLKFSYVDNPVIDSVTPKKSIRSGGITITATGKFLENIREPKMVVWAGTRPYEGDCKTVSDSTITCLSPMLDKNLLASGDKAGQKFSYGFRLDNVTEMLNLTQYDGVVFKKFTVYPDPIFEPFPSDIKSFQRKNVEFLTIGGQFLKLGIAKTTDVTVRIGDNYCNVTSLDNQLTCTPPLSQPRSLKGSRYPEVIVDVGQNLTIFLGYLKYEEAEFPLPLEYIIAIAGGGGCLVILVFVVIIMYRLKSKKNNTMMKKMQIQMDNLEAKVAKECKEAFAELQTDMTELNNDLYGQVAIPYWNYQTYCMRVLFPTHDIEMDHPVMRDLEVDFARRESVEKGLKLFSQMLNNKTFLLIFVRTLEGHKTFTMRDRVNVASLLSVALQTKMEYATDILKTLLAELIEKTVESKNQPKLLLRRTESIAEKMLTNWFTFLLYKFLRECAGEPLFMLYQAIKQQVAKGPVDFITNEARYSLSEDKLIRQQLDYKQMSVYVQDMDQFGQTHHPVKVLDCDTISQTKEKILDAIYKNAPFSSRYVRDSIDLVLYENNSPDWSNGPKGSLVIQDDDMTTKVESDYKRLNTLAHYKVPDGAYMSLRPKAYYNSSLSSNDKSGSKHFGEFSVYARSPSLNRTMSPQGLHTESDGTIKYYHLVKQHDSEPLKEGDRGSKMVSEIYLTRLLATKGTLQQFVDDLFERIFSTAHRGTVLPLAIKYMFDFLDDQALHHGIQESEVVHTWKSNSLPLRFWVNVIKNPDFVFDIYKSPIVDSCLSVVAQTFMDSCSISEHRLGINSPSSKLLYAKDIPKYKKWVERYYQDIKMMPAISDQDMTAMMTEESRLHQDEFNTSAALYELYKYVQKYNEELWQALDEDEFAKKNKLTYKLEQVRLTMEAEVFC